MFLGIDCGTQGTKAVLFDEEGKSLGSGQAPHQLLERSTGAREQHPEWWIEAMIQAVRSAISGTSPDDVKVISVSGQQHGLVILDGNLQCIRPAKLWNDTETAPQNEKLLEYLGGPSSWFEQIGIIPLTGYTVSKLLWLKEEEPDNFARIRHILLPHEYLNYWLTGRLAAEYGDASGTGYFDVRSRQWAEKPLAAVDSGTGFLSNALPPLIAPDGLLGPLRPEAALELGLTTKCLVSAGGGDNMMGAIGTGNVTEGIATISLGTSSTVYCFSSKPVGDKKGWIAPFCSSSGGWLPLVCTMNATNVTENMLRLLGRDVSFVSEALASTFPGADGITFLPFLNGERTPDLPSAQGSIFGLSANNTHAANMMRATVEGVTFGILAGLKLILAQGQAKQILLIGGGARSEGWRQLIADAAGTVIQFPKASEAGCLGAAIQAMWALSKHQGRNEPIESFTQRCVAVDSSKMAIPDPEKHALYQEAFLRYRKWLRNHYGVQE